MDMEIKLQEQSYSKINDIVKRRVGKHCYQKQNNA